MDLGGGAGSSGDRQDLPRVSGPAKTFSPVHLYDLRLTAGHQVDVALPEGSIRRCSCHGQVVVNGAQHVGEVELALLGQQGRQVTSRRSRIPRCSSWAGSRSTNQSRVMARLSWNTQRRNHSRRCTITRQERWDICHERDGAHRRCVLGLGLSLVLHRGNGGGTGARIGAGAGTRPCLLAPVPVEPDHACNRHGSPCTSRRSSEGRARCRRSTIESPSQA